MKVQLKQDLSDVQGLASGHLKRGGVYTVLEILMSETEASSYRLITAANEDSALFDVSLFEIVDNTISAHWKVYSLGENGFEMTLEQWSVPGFWEAFYDLDPDAKVAFEEGVKLLEAEGA